ncbi:MAG TPA: hypothetical protein VMZ92_21970 [Planctomycetota bacterium]|nr:hypothetical protein [Planctomycetota bacterium]
MTTVKRTALLLTVFAVVFSAHVLSVITTPYDSMFSIHTAMSILSEGNTDLDEYASLLAAKDYYNIDEVNGHQYARYPVGPSLLALPFVAVQDVYCRLVHGRSYRKELERGIPKGFEKFVASVVVAATSVLIYLIAVHRLKRVSGALVIVFVFAFCTSAWSVASRALWQHGPSMLALSATLYLIVLAEERPKLIQFAGLPLALSYVIRPYNAISVVLVSLLILLRHRRYFLRFLMWAMVVAVPFVAANFRVYGFPLPLYHVAVAPEEELHVLEALAGHWVSPGRGLLVFSPVLVFSLAGIGMKLRQKQMDALDVTLLAIVFLHWVAISCRPHWWGGHCFGPRYFSDMLPFFMYFLIPVVGKFRSPLSVPRMALIVTFVCLSAVSFYVHFRGANDWPTWVWVARPEDIDDHPERLWDWDDPQFLR